MPPIPAARTYHFSTHSDKNYSISIRVAITPCCKEISFSMLSAKIYSICIRVAITPCCKDISFSMLSLKFTHFASGLPSLPAARKYQLACFQLKFTQFAPGLPFAITPCCKEISFSMFAANIYSICIWVHHSMLQGHISLHLLGSHQCKEHIRVRPFRLKNFLLIISGNIPSLQGQLGDETVLRTVPEQQKVSKLSKHC